MAKVRVACIGTGYFSRFHYDAWRRIEDVDLVACVSLDLEAARATVLPAFDDVEKMLTQAKPDLVDIITPPSTHLDIIVKCAEAGIRTIICQKPFCENLDQAREAVGICRKAGVTLIVHENFRFQPWYRCMKQAIDDGLLGEMHQFTFRLRTGDGQGPRAYLDRQPYFQKMERFLIRETGVHWIDTFRFLFGEPKSVYADLRQLNPVIAGEDAGYFLMEFDSGKRALFDANRHLDHDAENHRMTLGEGLVEGSKGTITLSGSGAVTFRGFGERTYETLLAAQDWDGFGGDCVYALQCHVIEALKGNTLFENTGEDYLRNLELEEAIYESTRLGRKLVV